MTLEQIIDVADAAYPDGLVRQYHDDHAGDFGDTLAKFIAVEIKDTYDGAACARDQLRAAATAMDRAHRELGEVVKAFEDAHYHCKG